jgi:hypothetical protein
MNLHEKVLVLLCSRFFWGGVVLLGAVGLWLISEPVRDVLRGLGPIGYMAGYSAHLGLVIVAGVTGALLMASDLL